MNAKDYPCQVNTGTTVAIPTGKPGYKIYVVAATANFSGDGTLVTVGTNNCLPLSASPLLINQGISGATVGTVFHYFG